MNLYSHLNLVVEEVEKYLDSYKKNFMSDPDVSKRTGPSLSVWSPSPLTFSFAIPPPPKTLKPDLRKVLFSTMTLAETYAATPASLRRRGVTQLRWRGTPPNGEWIASGDVSGTVRIWGAHDDHVLKKEFKVLAGRIDDLQWSADGMRIVASGDGKGKSLVRAFM